MTSSVGMMTAKMSLPILAIFCTSFCMSCQIQQLQHLSIAAAPFPNQDWGTIPAEHNEEENQRPQLRWDSLLAPAHQHEPSKKGGQGSTRHLRTLKASHLRTLQTSHPRTEKPRHPRTKSGHPRTLMLGTSHFVGWGGVG